MHNAFSCLCAGLQAMSINQILSLSQLGWRPFFQQQLSLQELEASTIGRVIAHHKSLYRVQSERGVIPLAIRPSMPRLTVGDWILIDDNDLFIRELERLSSLSRKAAGSKIGEQLIAANVDTLFVVSSMNHDFSLNRIERYLSIAREGGCEPAVVLTKADCCDEPDMYSAQVSALDPFLAVETVNALDSQVVETLKPWCEVGRSVAFVGSSGVGKSTLVNALMNSQIQPTSCVRAEDSKGRHTTTSRSLFTMPSGALLIDTPGVRELQIASCKQGVEETFSDIHELARKCRFSDCQHDSEPLCAVKQAVVSGVLDARRVENYVKLLREQERNGESIEQMRNRSKSFGKLVRTIQAESRSLKGK